MVEIMMERGEGEILFFPFSYIGKGVSFVT
jgi:hypothetical protein